MMKLTDKGIDNFGMSTARRRRTMCVTGVIVCLGTVLDTVAKTGAAHIVD